MESSDQTILTGDVIVEIHDAKTGKLKSRDVLHNLVTNAGKASVADMVRGSVGRGLITYEAVGTGTATPAPGNTTLQTEIARKQISLRNRSGKVAEFRTFFNQHEAVGVLREIGLFGDAATNDPDTGTLFARLNISRTKTDSDTLTITHSIAVG